MEFTNRRPGKKPNTIAIYTVSKATLIKFHVLGGLMLVGGFYLIGLWISKIDEWGWLVPGTLLIVMAVIGYLDLKVSKLTTTDYSLKLEELFKTRELSIADIRGYSLEGRKLFIRPVSKLYKTIYVSDYTVLENYKEIFDWLALNIRNLDAEGYHEDMEEILVDDNFFANKHERLAVLKKSKQLCSQLNYLGAAICIWVFVYPHPYDYAILAGVSYPLLMLIVFYLKSGSISLNDGRRQNDSFAVSPLSPSLGIALFMPLVGLSVRFFVDYRLLHVPDMFLPALIVIIILGGVFYSILTGANRKTQSSTITWVYAAMFVIAYAFIVPTLVNCNFDYGKAEKFPAQIISQVKYENPKPVIYNLTLSPWGTSKGGEIEVSKQLYEQVKKGDTVHVIVKPGLFKMKWFYVTR